MSTSALDEKINKIKIQNEEIKRRYEEVEADKKNAAKLNALVQMVPSGDWPERKEPPEFIRRETTKSNSKPRTVKEHHDRQQQYLIRNVEGKKHMHKFAEGDGPPADPKYNFLADSDRDGQQENCKEIKGKHKGHNKQTFSGSKKKNAVKNSYKKENREQGHQYSSSLREDSNLEYEAWRAERNRIDEARINRQRTAEGSWRREWDNDKVNTNEERDSHRKESRFSLNDTNKRENKEFERRHQVDGDYLNRNQSGLYRNSHYGSRNNHAQFNSQNHHLLNEYSKNFIEESTTNNDERIVMASEKCLKITLNQGGNSVKGQVMSVKVNSPSIAGTGRVGPRQKTRLTYSSQAEVTNEDHEVDDFLQQESFDDRANCNSGQRMTIGAKSLYTQRKKENLSNSRLSSSHYSRRNEPNNDEQLCGSLKQSGERRESFWKTYMHKKGFKDDEKSLKLGKFNNSVSFREESVKNLSKEENNISFEIIKGFDDDSGLEEQSGKLDADGEMKKDSVCRRKDIESFRVVEGDNYTGGNLEESMNKEGSFEENDSERRIVEEENKGIVIEESNNKGEIAEESNDEREIVRGSDDGNCDKSDNNNVGKTEDISSLNGRIKSEELNESLDEYVEKSHADKGKEMENEELEIEGDGDRNILDETEKCQESLKIEIIKTYNPDTLKLDENDKNDESITDTEKIQE